MRCERRTADNHALRGTDTLTTSNAVSSTDVGIYFDSGRGSATAVSVTGVTTLQSPAGATVPIAGHPCRSVHAGRGNFSYVQLPFILQRNGPGYHRDRSGGPTRSRCHQPQLPNWGFERRRRNQRHRYAERSNITIAATGGGIKRI
jgi:hypothetical protein